MDPNLIAGRIAAIERERDDLLRAANEKIAFLEGKLAGLKEVRAMQDVANIEALPAAEPVPEPAKDGTPNPES